MSETCSLRRGAEDGTQRESPVETEVVSLSSLPSEVTTARAEVRCEVSLSSEDGHGEKINARVEDRVITLENVDDASVSQDRRSVLRSSKGLPLAGLVGGELGDNRRSSVKLLEEVRD